MKVYKSLKKQEFCIDSFSLIPIRMQDKLDILKWRNEQIYHLRQSEILTPENQDSYFNNVVSKLFDQEQPSQLLFSLLERGICIGYGGLVHINWIDKNAEISFIMDTSLEKHRFDEIWRKYLYLIEMVAFEDLKMHKIFTFAFDIRPHLYENFTKGGFVEEARLKEHCFYDGEYKDVVIHSKIRKYGNI